MMISPEVYYDNELKGKDALFSESGFDERIKAEAEKSETLYLYDLKTIVTLKK